MCSVVIYSVFLSSLGTNEENHHGHLHHEAEFPLRERDQLKYMDPYSGRALLHCSSSSIQILHWRDDNRRSTIPIEQDALDEASIASLAHGSRIHYTLHIPVEWNHVSTILWPVYSVFQSPFRGGLSHP